jgi:hypothetical protein
MMKATISFKVERGDENPAGLSKRYEREGVMVLLKAERDDRIQTFPFSWRVHYEGKTTISFIAEQDESQFQSTTRSRETEAPCKIAQDGSSLFRIRKRRKFKRLTVSFSLQLDSRGSPSPHLPPKSPTPALMSFTRSPLPSPASRLSPRLLGAPSTSPNPSVEPPAEGVRSTSPRGAAPSDPSPRRITNRGSDQRQDRVPGGGEEESERMRRWSDPESPRAVRRKTKEMVRLPSAGGGWEVTAHALKVKLAGAEKLVEGANKLAARLFDEAAGRSLSRSPSAAGGGVLEGGPAPQAVDVRRSSVSGPKKTHSSPQILTPEQQRQLLKSHLRIASEAMQHSGSEGDLRRLKAREGVAGNGLIVDETSEEHSQPAIPPEEGGGIRRKSLAESRRKSSSLIRQESLANRDTYAAQIERMREEFKATREVQRDAVRSLRGASFCIEASGNEEWNRGPVMMKPRPLSARPTTIKLPPILGEKLPKKGLISGS